MPGSSTRPRPGLPSGATVGGLPGGWHRSGITDGARLSRRRSILPACIATSPSPGSFRPNRPPSRQSSFSPFTPRGWCHASGPEHRSARRARRTSVQDRDRGLGRVLALALLRLHRDPTYSRIVPTEPPDFTSVFALTASLLVGAVHSYRPRTGPPGPRATDVSPGSRPWSRSGACARSSSSSSGSHLLQDRADRTARLHVCLRSHRVTPRWWPFTLLIPAPARRAACDGRQSRIATVVSVGCLRSLFFVFIGISPTPGSCRRNRPTSRQSSLSSLTPRGCCHSSSGAPARKGRMPDVSPGWRPLSRSGAHARSSSS